MVNKESTSSIICPYCNHEHKDPWDYQIHRDGSNMNCHQCGKEFEVYCGTEFTYYSSKIKEHTKSGE